MMGCQRRCKPPWETAAAGAQAVDQRSDGRPNVDWSFFRKLLKP
jgi:hypothetical protein